MAKWKFDGLDDYVAQLEKLEDFSHEMIGQSVWSGAKYVADKVKEAIGTIPVDDRKYVWSGDRRGITPEQRDGLLDGFGIASMRNDNGFLNVKIGFDGYNDVRSKKWPKGQPNLMVARMVESGTSFMPKLGTISKVVQTAKKQCEEEMRKALDDAINKETK